MAETNGTNDDLQGGFLKDPSGGWITREYVGQIAREEGDIPRVRHEGDLRAFGREYGAQLALGDRLEREHHPELARQNLIDADAPITVPRVNFTASSRRR